jgi:alpha-L-rhamnosidase
MTASIAPVDLRCEYLADPLGIDVARPRLGWVLDGDGHGLRQSAFQVLAAPDPHLLATDADPLWDTGKVPGDQTAHIAYGGPPLGSRQRIWWTVRVWDQDDAVSPYSRPAFWEMGLLRPDDWRGHWIGLQRPDEARRQAPDLPPGTRRDLAELDLAPCPYLRTTFSLSRPVRRARLYATARGLYEFRLNGHRAGDAVLAPGWTDYRKRIQYQTYDVGDLLREDENVLGAILGTGWYAGYVGWLGENKHYGLRPQLLAQLVVEHDDGSTTVVVSDETWRVTTGPIRYSDLLMGEAYDARAELPGWDLPGYDDRAWHPVAVEPRDDVLLVADRAEPVRIIDEIRPRSVTRLSPDIAIVDLGQNIAGWVRLRVRGAAGTTVRLRFGERLDPDGTLYTENLRTAHQTDFFTLRGGSEETYEPRFTFHGFQYVEVTGYPGELTSDAIAGRAVGNDLPITGDFRCSSDMVDRLQRNIVWGQRGNFLSVPTDCPQRDERLGWLGDAQVFVRTSCFNAAAAPFWTKWLTDVADARSPEGAFPDVAPRLIVTTDGAPAWGNAGVIVPWTLYQCYGDRRLIEDHYDAMTAWLTYLQDANPDLIWTNRRNNDYGDWLAVGETTPKDLIGTAYFAQDARLLAQMARAIDRPHDATRYDDLFARIKSAFLAAYVDDTGHVAGDSQTAYALALAMDLLPASLRPAAARHLVANIARHDWHLTTGFVGVSHLCPVLTEAGYADVAYRLLLNETFPSWGYMIARGATTMWERWDGWTEDHGFQTPQMNSFNHYAFGAIGDWLYRYVAGIDLDPDRPGYQHVVVRPFPGGGLTHAAATYRSVRGPITSEWRHDGDNFLLTITIPANATATVLVPTTSPESVVLLAEPSSTDQSAAPAIVRSGGDRVTFSVGSGRYAFRSTLAR